MFKTVSEYPLDDSKNHKIEVPLELTVPNNNFDWFFDVSKLISTADETRW